MPKFIIIILLLFFNFSSLSFANEFGDEEMVEETTQVSTSSDPLLYFNKVMFHTYKTMYRFGVKYVAIAYNALPLYAKNRLLYFSINVKEPTSALNHFLQLRINSGLESSFRFVVNSTLGVFGMWDVMGALGMPKKDNDFGATLYFMGVPEGPYLILFGPSNLRDSIGTATAMYAEQFYFPQHDTLAKTNIPLWGGSDGFGVSSSTAITVVFFADFYRQNESLLTSSFDEYSLIKEMFTNTRRMDLQRIAGYD
ncbi:MAG: VacJ family lipoprotein [Alphaproteobacteria bacterium]|nr:VacJ family lipoprotein [Alphaproteobacteria bacterium]